MAWGWNEDGQLGLGYTSPYESLPQPVPGLTDVVAVEEGIFSSLGF